jgi:hypothetical protein
MLSVALDISLTSTASRGVSPMADAGSIIESLNKKENLVAFLADPKAYAQKQGINMTDDRQVKSLEFAAKHFMDTWSDAQQDLGLSSVKAADDWGIGAGCCNARTLLNQIMK